MGEFVEIEVEVIKKTEEAVLINDGSIEAWILLSQIEGDCPEEGVGGTISIPDWLAEERGLI
jgi:hypothetical protein